jgi:uncharacterized protein
VFRSPAPAIKIEFQGGEPLLNFNLIREVVLEGEHRNVAVNKNLAFVIATNLALLDDSVIDFCREHRVFLSTSLDGPMSLHNSNRPHPGGDSWQRTVRGIRRIHEEIGDHAIAALMTTTEPSLAIPEEIIDTYVELGLHDIFLRPISPYGFAVQQRGAYGYDVDQWLNFYERGLRHILHLNEVGVPVVEQYAALVVKKMLGNEDPGYVDLRSPSGIGIGGIVFN